MCGVSLWAGRIWWRGLQLSPLKDGAIQSLLRMDLNRIWISGRGVLVMGFACLSCGAWGEDALAVDVDVVELRETIGKIVDVKAQAAGERMAWEARKAEMAELLELHRREMAMLDEELEVAGGAAAGYDEAKRGAEEAIAEFRRVRALAGGLLERLKPRALALADRFPAPLAEEAKGDRVKLESWEAGDEPREGLQAILGMVAKAEQFNRRIRRSSEVRDGQEVEVIYLGLARAYYLGRSGVAGVGEPGPEGWAWTERKSIAGEVRKALAQLDKKRPPDLVELPVKISGEGN